MTLNFGAMIRLLRGFKLTDQSILRLRNKGVPSDVLIELEVIKNQLIIGKSSFVDLLKETIGEVKTVQYRRLLFTYAGRFGRITNSIAKMTNATKRQLHFILLRVRNRDRFILKTIQGSKMYLDLNDKGISRELALSDIREEVATRYMYQTIRPDDVVMDIGSNIGYFLLLEALLSGKNGKVYGIEPVPENVALLRRNISINDYENVEVYNLAIGDKNSVEKIYLSSKANWHSMRPFPGQNSVGEMYVTMCTTDAFLIDKEYPNFIRMDVEGFEGQIINGMTQTLDADRPLKLFIELHPHLMTKVEVISILTSLKRAGFEVAMIAKRNVRYNYTIDSILNDRLMVNGRKGAFQIFFERE